MSRSPGSSGWQAAAGNGTRDEVAIEEPLEIRVDGEALAVTMRTPGEDEELAAGFLAGEALISGPADIAVGRARPRSSRPTSSRCGPRTASAATRATSAAST